MDELLGKLKALGLPHEPILHEVVTTAEAQVSTDSIQSQLLATNMTQFML
jgi:hypothetical protein